VPDFCTCGAELPPDARFCHKCGKPQREEPVPERVEVEPPPVKATPPPAVDVAHRIDFHNPVALRIAFMAATLASVLNLVPFLNYGCMLWLLAAGFFAVYMYSRRTGQILSVRSGARMGWLTGVFTFVIGTIFYTLTIISISVHSGGLSAFYRQNLGNMTLPEQSVQQALDILETPGGIAGVIIFSLVVLFAVFTLFPILGGAIGAKVLSKD
jgi:hypothetical protein